MDTSQELTAWDVVNRYPEQTLERIIREYGEEHRARRIARTVAVRRERGPIGTCLELAGLVAEVCGKKGGRHPATRTFQAIRMEVNGEVQEIADGLSSAVQVLRRGGRLSVISYHSIEDRIAKHFIRDGAREGLVRVITKKPVTPGPDEVRRNPSSRSAKLRGAERL
jgi:16S rRNA (cytosine1402-N4)-methyltransferase